jgi:glutathione-specific gamma-glutamylcyclotransferase
MKAPRRMALTPDLMARIHRAMEAPRPDPNLVYHTDADHDAVVCHLLEEHASGLNLPRPDKVSSCLPL